MAREPRRWLGPLALAFLLVIAGCSGGAGDAGEQATAGPQRNDAAAQQTQAEGESAGFQARQRALVRTGTVSLRVESYDTARRNLMRETERLGGFVSDTAQRVHARNNATWTTGELVLRVPSENFSALLSGAKAVGEVREANTETRDVTDRLVDIEARLENLRAQRERLRDLYEEANDTENVLAVQERLSEVQTEIERLEASQQSLERQVAYSTITVRLTEPRPDPSTESTGEAWYDTGLIAAFVSSVEGVVVVARALAVGLAYVAPYVLAFGVPLVGGYAVWRRRRSPEVPTGDPGVGPADAGPEPPAPDTEEPAADDDSDNDPDG